MGRRDIVRIQEEGHTVLSLLAGSPLGSEQLLFSREEQVPPSHTTPFAWTCFPVPTLPFSAPHLNAMPFYLNTRLSPIIKSKGKISALNQIVCRSLSAPTTRKHLLRSHHPGVTFLSFRTTSQIDLPSWSSPLRIIRYPTENGPRPSVTAGGCIGSEETA